MHKRKSIHFVETIREHCRKCYTCVRECPAKAISIAGGQAEIIPDRCIGCGNCVRVCSQKAKVIHNTENEVAALLHAHDTVSACLAPSFPAAFPDVEYPRVIGALRQLGFSHVHEVAFGADLVAEAYKELLNDYPDASFIGTTCPAVVNYVECYYQELIPRLAPVVSPMSATALALRELYGPGMKIVFIGPCLAKKGEDSGEDPGTETDAVVTFSELMHMLEERGIDPAVSPESTTDPPYGNLGGLFPVSGGILQAADIEEDLVTGSVISADGRSMLIETIKEYSRGEMDCRLLEILSCNGCIMGSGMGCDIALFRRRGLISRYVRERTEALDEALWEEDIHRFSGLNLSRNYLADDQRMAIPSRDELKKVLEKMGKTEPQDELNCGACGYESCVEHATAIFQGLAEHEMCLPNTIDQLNQAVDDLAVSNTELAKTQDALLQSEKLASMGQLAAGIAHELNNPLGVVLMYAHLLMEEQESGKEDLKMIAEQAERCKHIVSGLLHFARQNKAVRQPANLGELVAKSLRSVSIPKRISLSVKNKLTDPHVEVDQEQIVQVITNLISNACAAIPESGDLTITLSQFDHTVEIEVHDTGSGIPEENRKKIFEPFFTTKEFGKGTGLGLAMVHGIIRMHRGEISLETNDDPGKGPTGSCFKITMPVKELE